MAPVSRPYEWKKVWIFSASEAYLEITRWDLFNFVSTASTGSSIEQNCQRLCTQQRPCWTTHPFWLLRAFKSSITRRGKVFSLHHRWLLQDDIGINDEAEIWSFQNFQAFDDSYEESTWKTIKCLRTDNDLEFCSIELNELCRDEGIARRHTIRYTPHQNEVAERINRTLLERVICMLSNLGLNRSF